MKKRLLIFALTTLLVPASFCGAEGKEYTLKLERPDKPGQKSRESFRITIENSQLMRQGTKKLKEEASDIQAELAGMLEVNEIGPKGNVKKVSLTVEKFSLQEEEKAPTRPVAPGGVIVATLDDKGKEQYEAGGKAITGAAAKVLKELLPLKADHEKQIDDDKLSNTGVPHAMGSTWTVNAAALIESMSEDMPLVIKEADVDGKLKFPDLKTVDGVECARVLTAVTIKPSGVKDLPPNFKTQKVALQIEGEQLVPVADTGMPIPQEKMSISMDLSGTFPSPAGVVSLTVFTRMNKERTGTPVK